MVRSLPAVWLVGLAPLAGACASPTLPLPPPSTEVTQTVGVDADHVTLSGVCGSVPGSVYVQFINVGHPGGAPVPAIDTGVIVFSSQCGAYTASVFGHQSDQIEITYEVGLQVSTPKVAIIGQP